MGCLGFNFNLLDQVRHAPSRRFKCFLGRASFRSQLLREVSELLHNLTKTVFVCNAAQSTGFFMCDILQLSFYGYYHQKHGNQIIHFFFVPSILWSACVWFAYTGPLAGVDLPSQLHSLPKPIAE